MEKTGDMRWRVGMIIVFLLNVQILLFVPPSAAQQILPGIELECSTNSIAVDWGEDSAQTEVVDCILTNDRPYSEEVMLEYNSESIEVSGPGSLTIAGSSDSTFQFIINPDRILSPQTYTLNVTAEVVSAVGIPIGFLTNIEEWVVDIEVMEYTRCGANYGVNSLNIEAGQNAIFTASYGCESNIDRSLDIELHLVKNGESSEGAWDSGFNVISEKCSVVISEGNGYENCEFELTTPSNIEERYEGCLIILDERILTAGSCQNEDSLQFMVEPKESGIINSVGGNISIFNDYDVTKEQLFIAGGVFIGSLLFFIVAIRYTRR